MGGFAPKLRRAMRMEAVRVIADDREKAGGVIEALRKLDGVEVQVRRLAVGDFEVEGRFAVERKTLADFVHSVFDARLFRQTTALAKTGRGAVLILEGGAKEFSGLAMSRQSLQGALITVSVFFGIPVLRARDPAETAALIAYLARQSRRVARGGFSRTGYRPKGKHARQLFVLQGLPGVGPERAAQLLDRFGSVEAVAQATLDQLATVEGIGGITAARIRWILEPDRYDPRQRS